jgi:pimeloyl-ACP methyl ester carboxylesterase
MKHTFILLFALLCGYTGIALPYQIGHITVTFIDSARSARPVPTEIYYPADVAGDNVSFTTAIPGKTPSISFGHGFVMTYDAYFNVRDAVVGAGYIIAFPTTEGTLSPSHDAFGKDLAFVLRKLRTLGATTTSVLYNHVDTMNCVMGHSMGGGAAFLGAATDGSIKSLATLAPAETTPSAIGAAATLSLQAMVFAGLNDCVTPPAANQLPMYNSLTSACKHYIGITGGSHCQMALTSPTCSFGEATCTPAPAITRSAQHAVIESYLLPWLDRTLRANCVAGARFDSLLATDPATTFLKNCTLCPPTGIYATNTLTKPTSIFPNPCRNEITVTPTGLHTTITIYTLMGTTVLKAEIAQQSKILLTNIAAGTYIYEITGEGESQRGVLVKE